MIGILDSGLGGLRAARMIADRLPAHDLIYFGDTARTPYGNRSASRIMSCTRENLAFLFSRGVRLLVITCHSTASLAAGLGPSTQGVPMLEIISPAVKHALSISRHKRIGVLASRAALASGVFEEQIRQAAPTAKVYGNTCPLFSLLVEEGLVQKPEGRKIIKKCLLPLKVRQIDTLILAGNHFSHMKALVQAKIGKQVKVVDSAEVLAKFLVQYLKENAALDQELSQTGTRKFLFTDITPHIQAAARIMYRGNLALQPAE